MSTDAAPSSGPWAVWWWLVLQQRRRIALCAVVSAAWMLSMMVPPYVLGLAIDQGLGSSSPSALWGWTGLLLLVGTAVALLSIVRHRLMTWVRATAAHRTVTVVHEQSLALGASRAATAEVVSIGLADAWTLGRSLVATGPGVGAVVGYVTAAILLFGIDPLLAIIVLLGAPVLALVLGPLLSRLRRLSEPQRTQQSVVTGRMVDMITGLGILSGLGGTEHVRHRFAADSALLRRRGFDLAPTQAALAALGTGLPPLFLATVMWLAARLALAGEISAGQVVAVFGYTALLVVPVSMVIESATEISRAMVSAGRVQRLMALSSRRGQEPGGLLVDDQSGVRVTPGLFQAVVCDNARTASDVLDRLAGLTDGGALRSDVLLADNRGHLFAGSLQEVVAGAGVADHDRTLAALRVAAAEELIMGSPAQTMITDRGRNLSGGQQQRLRLARAVAAEPEVLLADDPTSAVDAHTENVMAQRLRTARTGRTTVVATTSALLLAHTDQVTFMVDGRVHTTGDHHTLLTEVPGYRRLVHRGAT
ncbi:ABC transporter transmembrane domain-containing protein [Propionibacteriaceae bacterium Y1685]|uniref:ABC transporter transmembrane domain-containing protein n=1 Tax=Microlunatus sp. Y1700 TaxID=3418487 RepID=UPI003B7F5C91